MAGALNIEVLDRLGRVKERVRAESFPITIGRAYSCEVILDDRYVSPEHVRIDCDEDGRVFVEDLRSTNGTQRLAPLATVTRVPLEDDMKLRLGHTVVRIRTGGHPVEPTARLIARVLPAGLLGNRALSVSLCIAVVSFFVADDYLAWFENFSALRLLSETAGLVLVLAVWAGLWSLVSRMLVQAFYFRQHCTVAAIWALLFAVFDTAIDYYAFAFSADASAEAIAWVGVVPLLAGLLYSHLRLCSASPPVRLALRSATAAGAVVALGGLVYLGAQVEDEWPAGVAFSSHLKPPIFQMAPSRGVEEFFGRARLLKERVDRLAEQ